MKRDRDVVRELLTKMKECSVPGDALNLSSFSSERTSEMPYHAELLLEKGLIDVQMPKTINREPHNFFLCRLTWNGHGFFDSIRSVSG